jgi:hypothetical protein
VASIGRTEESVRAIVWTSTVTSMNPVSSRRLRYWRIGGVDQQGVPILADEHRAAVPGQDPASLGDGSGGLGEGVQDLVGAHGRSQITYPPLGLIT